MKKCAIFGNPIKHSQSPYIHKLFAQQTNILCSYEAFCPKVKNFSESIKEFFKHKNNIGANITLPFKKQAFKIVDILTQRAKLAKSVNTLKKEKNFLIGDNTDGIGLINDLKKIKFITNKNNILLIGAGGAAYGIIFPLLSFKCKITVINRTYESAKKLVNNFKKYGIIKALPFNEVNNEKYDLIINATSCEAKNQTLSLKNIFIDKNVYCYDMFYKKHGITKFLEWCKNRGAIHTSDGLGMLLEQAAYSFFLWHNIFPDITFATYNLKKYFLKL